MTKLLVVLLFVHVLIIKAEEWDFDVNSKESVQKYWEKYKLLFNKHYDSATEENLRKYIFLDSILAVKEHNQNYGKGSVSFQIGINQFSDMSHNEFLHNLVTTYRTMNKTNEGSRFIPPTNIRLPEEVDWRKDGAVTDVKNQGKCNSCYTFSATGALEGQNFRKNHKLVSLSEQNIVDCSQKYGNQGCNGGLSDYSFKYIKRNKGVDTEESYPYEAKVGRCRYDPANKGATDRGYVEIKSRDEEHLQAAVATIGPIAISIDARHPSLQKYRGGVYYEPDCQPDMKFLGHAVLAVGYGTDPNDSNSEYWLVKNSWGEKWGEGGYIRIARNKDNHCGVATDALYPVV